MSNQNKEMANYRSQDSRLSYNSDGLVRRTMPESGYIAQKYTGDIDNRDYTNIVVPQAAGNIADYKQITSAYYQQQYMAQNQNMKSNDPRLSYYVNPNQAYSTQFVYENQNPQTASNRANGVMKSNGTNLPNGTNLQTVQKPKIQPEFNLAVTNQQVALSSEKVASLNPQQIRNSLQNSSPNLNYQNPEMADPRYSIVEQKSTATNNRNSILSPLSYTQAIYGNPGDQFYMEEVPQNTVGKRQTNPSAAYIDAQEQDGVYSHENYMSVHAGVEQDTETQNPTQNSSASRVNTAPVRSLPDAQTEASAKPGAQNKTSLLNILSQLKNANVSSNISTKADMAENDNDSDFDEYNLTTKDESDNENAEDDVDFPASWGASEKAKELARNTDFNARLQADQRDPSADNWYLDQKRGKKPIGPKKVQFTLPEPSVDSPAEAPVGLTFENEAVQVTLNELVEPLSPNEWDGQLTNADIVSLHKIGINFNTLKKLCPWAEIRPSDKPSTRHVQIQVKVQKTFMSDFGTETDADILDNGAADTVHKTDFDELEQKCTALQENQTELEQKYAALQENQTEMKTRYDEISSQACRRIEQLLGEKMQLEMELLKQQKLFADSKLL